MIAHLSSLVRRGALALGVLAVTATASAAAPLLLPTPTQVPTPAGTAIVPIGEGGDLGPQGASKNYDYWRLQRRGQGDWVDNGVLRERRGWRDRDGWGDRRGWRHRDRWDDDRRRHHRRSGIYFNFEAPAYRYVEPRRQYRSTGLSRAHIEWCYDRYRSYRAWDNTYVPRRGVRAQCYSPYI